jgi:hypothetical protein
MLKKIFVVASCVLLVMAAGCKKGETDPTADVAVVKSTTTCTPYRLVFGSQLAVELTSFATCTYPGFCAFPHMTTLQSGALSSGRWFQNIEAFDVPAQNLLLSEGQAVAIGMTPSGYSIWQTVFKTQTTPAPGYFTLYVEVTYRKCGPAPARTKQG